MEEMSLRFRGDEDGKRVKHVTLIGVNGEVLENFTVTDSVINFDNDRTAFAQLIVDLLLKNYYVRVKINGQTLTRGSSKLIVETEPNQELVA